LKFVLKHADKSGTSITILFCTCPSRQNARRIHSVRIDNSTFERVEEFKYLGTTLANQNSIVEEIKSRLRSGNACYHSVQNFFVFQVAIQKFKDQDI